ncbi:MAG: DNA helicase RecQ [Saprospiraceae bacterium]
MISTLPILKKYFGYTAYRDRQEEIINAVLQHKDVLVLMPTGGGKSICYQIPALVEEGTTIVVSPLIALMKDQVGALQANGIPAIYLNSSLNSIDEANNIKKLLENKIKLLYVSPEKAINLASGLLKQIKVSLIAIDEAHCISQWGHDFRPEYAQLIHLRNEFPNIPVIALTATADKITRKDILVKLGLKDPEIYLSSFDRPNFFISVKNNLSEKEKLSDIIKFIKSKPNESGIIYCLSRKTVESLSASLKANGISNGYYHAGMSSEDRSKIQEDFVNDDVKIICATIAFGMGIDKSNVRWVIHFNLPKNIESYYQEIGRAGRDGLASETILYYNLKDLILLTQFANESGQSEINLEKLQRMQQFAESPTCRRKMLLSYFGELYTQNCMSCDICKNPPNYIDGTIIAQKALSGILRADQKINIKLLIDLLRGSQSTEIKERKLDLLKTHGVGREYNASQWKHYILQLIQVGTIEIAYDEHFNLKVSEFGREIVFNQKPISLVEIQYENLEKAKTKSRVKTQVETADSEEDNLFERLRKLRKQIASEEGFAPYIIFHDSTLKLMVEQLPTSRKEMLQVSGISTTKYEKYAFRFESVIKDFISQSNIDEDKLNIDESKFRAMIQELKSENIPLNVNMLAKILTASKISGENEMIHSLSFYGIFKGKATLSTVQQKLNDYFKLYKIKI